MASTSSYRYGASQLRAALISKLSTDNSAGNQHNDALFKAVALCDGFLKSFSESPQAFEALKQDIKKTLAKHPPAHSKTSRQKPSSAGALSNVDQPANWPVSRSVRPASKGSTGSSAASSDLDWTLPPVTLTKKAFTKTSDYGRMIIMQDQQGKADEESERQTRMAAAVRARGQLDAQMGEVRARQQLQVQQRVAEAEELDSQLRQYHAEEAAKKVAQEEAHQQMRKAFKQQVDEKNRERAEERERVLREAKLDKMRAEEQKRQAEEEQAQRRAEAAEKLRQAQEVQRAQVVAKAAAVVQQQEEERLYNEECIKILDAKEAARVAEVEKVRARQRAMYERGGGVALQKGLEEAAREAEERSRKEAAAYEAKVKADEEERERRRKEAMNATLRTLDHQTAEKAEVKRMEMEEAKRVADQLTAEAAALKAEKAAAKRDKKERQRQTFATLKQAAADEAKQRYREATEVMGEREKKLHAKVLSGKERVFMPIDARTAPFAVSIGPK